MKITYEELQKLPLGTKVQWTAVGTIIERYGTKYVSPSPQSIYECYSLSRLKNADSIIVLEPPLPEEPTSPGAIALVSANNEKYKEKCICLGNGLWWSTELKKTVTWDSYVIRDWIPPWTITIISSGDINV